MRQLLTERYRDRLSGVLSCYDRMIVTGTLPGVCHAKGMTAFLSARGVRIFDNDMLGHGVPQNPGRSRLWLQGLPGSPRIALLSGTGICSSAAL